MCVVRASHTASNAPAHAHTSRVHIFIHTPGDGWFKLVHYFLVYYKSEEDARIFADGSTAPPLASVDLRGMKACSVNKKVRLAHTPIHCAILIGRVLE